MNCKKNTVEPHEMSACEAHMFQDRLKQIHEADKHTSDVKVFNAEEIAAYLAQQQ